VLLSAVAARAEQGPEGGPLLISSSSEVHGSVLSDTIVQRNCTLHVRGNLLGSLTIEPGANVIVEGSVDGKINNKGGRLLVNNKGLAACVTVEGPAEAEACGILKINLTNLAANYETLTKRTEAECAAMVNADAYGCGIGPIAGALAKSGCNTFFVSNLPEAKSVRAVAPHAAIYVLNGFYSGPDRTSRTSMPGLSSTARLNSPNGTSSSARMHGPAVARSMSISATAASACRRKKPWPLRRGCIRSITASRFC
jgi:hypothetical protein